MTLSYYTADAACGSAVQEEIFAGCSGNITSNYCSSDHSKLPLPVPVLDARASHLHCGAVKPASVRWGTVIKITIAHIGPALAADAAAASIKLHASATCRLVQSDFRRLTIVGPSDNFGRVSPPRASPSRSQASGPSLAKSGPPID
jgi:hypothetical protein